MKHTIIISLYNHNVIEVKNLTVEYDDKKAVLDDVSFSVGEKESVGILGANGTGKTTLFYSLLGLIDKKQGEVKVDNQELSKKNLLDIRKKMGLVFQNPDDQLFMPTVLDDVTFAPKNCKMDVDVAEEKGREILKSLRVSHLIDKSPIKLSGGEKRIVAIAGILITEPKIILFDEPTAFLDYPAKKNLIRIINDISAVKLIATHDIRFVFETCKRVFILKDGKIAKDITVDELKKNLNILEEYEIEGAR